MTEWDLEPGTRIRRKELHERFGGGGQSGVSASGTTANVFVFTDSRTADKNGYFDEWDGETLLYTGTGRTGDQTLSGPNGSLLNHRAANRTVRVFEGVRGEVTYVGPFVTDEAHPYIEDDRPDVNGGVRKVIMFRLQPAGSHQVQTTLHVRRDDPDTRTVEAVPVEEQNTERWQVAPHADHTEAEGREQKLVLRFKTHLESLGDTVTRHMYRTPGQRSPLFSDLFNETRNQLVEAKGGVSRPEIRMAIGQLLDYQALEPGDPGLGLLLPELPRTDLVELLLSLEIAVIYPSRSGFVDTIDGRFV